MKISVIVTTYNRPDALVKVLDGLLSQTRLPEEIIIADDGSGEETRQVVQSYLGRSSIRVAHVWQEDEGFRAARVRNLGILSATGNYLIFLDGDCIPSPYFIADHEKIAKPGAFFQGKRVLVNEDSVDAFSHEQTASFWGLVLAAVTGKISNSHHIFRIPFYPNHKVSKLSGIRSCNMGLFREDVLAVNGFNQEFIGWGREDTEFVIRLYRYGLSRIENPFLAVCYHLWHRENSRSKLEHNDTLMENIKDSSSYTCAFGLKELEQELNNEL